MNVSIIPGRFQPYLLSILRIMAGLAFLEHGTGKLLGFPHLGMSLSGMTVFTGVIELVGGALVTIGLFTRVVAFVLSGFMAFGYFLAHAPRGFFPAVNQGEAALLYCFVFLFVAAAGAGPWSIDRA